MPHISREKNVTKPAHVSALSENKHKQEVGLMLAAPARV